MAILLDVDNQQYSNIAIKQYNSKAILTTYLLRKTT